MSHSWVLPFFVSIPHSGEQVPEAVDWLETLPEVTLMRDVDRFVDKLYGPAIEMLSLPSIVTHWHRYVVDLNRKPDQFDRTAVEGALLKEGEEPKGLHWSQTTHGEVLIPKPMSMELHDRLVREYYEPFHREVKEMRAQMQGRCGVVYHLDLHSMPSMGTALHQDPGQERPEIVVSDFHGEKADSGYKDLVMTAYQEAGFQVAYNWPYVGGGITRMYGEPEKGYNTIQIEMNRNLYMNEETKELDHSKLDGIQRQLEVALGKIKKGIQGFLDG